MSVVLHLKRYFSPQGARILRAGMSLFSLPRDLYALPEFLRVLTTLAFHVSSSSFSLDCFFLPFTISRAKCSSVLLSTVLLLLLELMIELLLELLCERLDELELVDDDDRERGRGNGRVVGD